MRPSRPVVDRARRAALATLTVAALGGGALAVSSVWYAGDGPDGRPTTLEVTVDADGTARGRVFQAPPPAGARPGLDVVFEGTAAREEDRVRIDARARGLGLPDDGAALVIVADGVVSRTRGAVDLDPLGEALATFLPEEGPPWRASLPAIATGVRARTTLDDGSLEVSATGPFFYAPPWSELQIAPDPTDLAESVLTGLAQRAADPQAVSALWWDERVVEVASLTPELVSVRLDFYAFTGGAHPNTWYAFASWLREDDEWRRADACSALRALGYRCDPAALRTAIVVDLLGQEAAWVVEGSVDATTPWLLDPFTVTPRGLRFDYAPYDVGPYVQGPFQVLLPFDTLPAR
jgi:hypothetical protein